MDEISQKIVDGTAWREFCDLLADAGSVVLAAGTPDDPLNRAEGYRMLTRLLRGALEGKMEYGRASEPRLICPCHETVKIVGENPDNHYLGATLDGKYDYKVSGTRGEAKWISFNLFSGAGFGGGGPGTGATLHEEQMHIEPDGTFEVIISQKDPGVPNWLKSEEDTRSLALRQTFLNRKQQTHAELTIERIDDLPRDVGPLTADEVYFGLIYAGYYIKGVSQIGAGWATRQAQWPNIFTDEAELEETDKFKDPQIKWHQAYFNLQDDEMLVIEVTPPECEYWMIALHNHWMETLDYVRHQATLNCHSAQLEPDGSVRLVVAKRDPGLPNWLDTAGHNVGTVGVRWVGPDVIDKMPNTRVLPIGASL